MSEGCGAPPGNLCGGLGDAKPADAEIQALCDTLKEEVVKKTGGNFCTFQAVSYKLQVVAGRIYYIKVKTGDDCIHLKVLEPLPHTKEPVSLMAFQLSKKEDDQIKSF